MELQIHPKSYFLPTFSWTNFEVGFSRVQKMKISVSLESGTHFQGSKGTNKHSKNHPKTTPKPQKNIVKIASFFYIEISSIFVLFGFQNAPQSSKYFMGQLTLSTFVLKFFQTWFQHAFWKQNGRKSDPK